MSNEVSGGPLHPLVGLQLIARGVSILENDMQVSIFDDCPQHVQISDFIFDIMHAFAVKHASEYSDNQYSRAYADAHCRMRSCWKEILCLPNPEVQGPRGPLQQLVGLNPIAGRE